MDKLITYLIINISWNESHTCDITSLYSHFLLFLEAP